MASSQSRTAATVSPRPMPPVEGARITQKRAQVLYHAQHGTYPAPMVRKHVRRRLARQENQCWSNIRGVAISFSSPLDFDSVTDLDRHQIFADLQRPRVGLSGFHNNHGITAVRITARRGLTRLKTTVVCSAVVCSSLMTFSRCARTRSVCFRSGGKIGATS
jgi:hypothetical protein